MFSLLAKWVTGHPKKIIALWVVLLVLSGYFALQLQLGDTLSAGGFNDPKSQSMEAQKVLEKNFSNQYEQQLLVVVKNDDVKVTDSKFEDVVKGIKTRIQQDKMINDVETYYDNKNESFMGKDQHTTFLLLGMNSSEDEVATYVPKLTQTLKDQVATNKQFETLVTGGPALSYALNETTKKELSKAEMIAFPAMILILLLVFRTVASTIVPLMMSAFALGITMAISYFIAQQVTLNVLLTNTISMIGLAVIVDYALFIISRFRQELETTDVIHAVQIAVKTAGRAVVFSGATVAISLSSLFLPRMMIFDSIAIGGVIVVAIAVLVAITLLPAILTVMGHRINWGKLPILYGRTAKGRWASLANGLMKRPVLFLIPALLLLGSLTLPAKHLNMQVPVASASILHQGDPARTGFEVLSDQFSKGDIFPIQVVLKSNGKEMLSAESLDQIDKITKKLEATNNVEKVTSLTNWNKQWDLAAYKQAYQYWDKLPSPVQNQLTELVNHDKGNTTTLLLVASKFAPDSKESHEVVKNIRSILSNTVSGDYEVYVGGQTAIGLDFDQRIFDNLPAIIAFVLVVSFIVLVVSFRSIMLPLKALILNTLVTLASMGMLVLYFQSGDTGTINSITPVVLFAVLFGVSMDYEVLIVSRIRELYDEGHTTKQSIAEGISETAGLVNGAAAIMIAVFTAFALVDLEVVNELGFGLAVAILLDATLVRTVLVPTIMGLLKGANWWLPFGKKRNMSVTRESKGTV